MKRKPRQARQDKARHDDSCAQRIRVLRLAEAGDPPSPPATLLRAIAAEIISCCGQPPLRAHRLACGWTMATAIEALRDHGVSKRSWYDWEAGNHPSRSN